MNYGDFGGAGACGFLSQRRQDPIDPRAVRTTRTARAWPIKRPVTRVTRTSIIARATEQLEPSLPVSPTVTTVLPAVVPPLMTTPVRQRFVTASAETKPYGARGLWRATPVITTHSLRPFWATRMASRLVPRMKPTSLKARCVVIVIRPILVRRLIQVEVISTVVPLL